MSTQILDGFGRPAHYQGGVSRYESPQDDTYRLGRPNLDQDAAYTLNRWRHRILLSDCRYIATWGTVQGAVAQKSQYVSSAGWFPQYLGEDEEWGERAEALLDFTGRMADVRGFPFTFARNWQIGCRLWDIDGDFFRVNLRTKSGLPVSQFVEAHRVGTRLAQGNVVRGGRYDGAREITGIVYNDSGREIAYHVLGSTPERDKYISARDMHHIYDPWWFSENRGVPTIAYAILDWYDIKETRDAEKISQKANSYLTFIESNESGVKSINENGTVYASGVKPGLKPAVDMMQKGLIRIVKEGTGKIKAHTSARPSDGWLNFDKKIEDGAFFGMGWRREMAYTEKLNSGALHAFADQINSCIHERWSKLVDYARQEIIWRIAVLIERGDLPEVPDWDKWGFTPPARFSVNSSRAMAADIAAVRAGGMTMPQIIRAQGRTPKQHLREQGRYLRDKKLVAKEFDVEPEALGRTDQPGDRSSEDRKPADPQE